MRNRARIQKAALLASVLGLALAGCSSNGAYRVAAIGNVPGSEEASGGTSTGSDSGGTQVAENGGGSAAGAGSGISSSNGSASSGTTPGTGSMPTAGNGSSAAVALNPVQRILVSAGNSVIGVAGKHNALAESVNATLPPAAPVTGTVTAVLRKTGQTVVDLGQGRSMLLDSARAKLGEIVTLDLGQRKVVGAAGQSGLLGVSVLSPAAATGAIAGINVASGSQTVSAAVAPVTQIVTSVAGSGATPGVVSAVAPLATVAGAAGSTVSSVVSGAVGTAAIPTAGMTHGALGGTTAASGSVVSIVKGTAGIVSGALAPLSGPAAGLSTPKGSLGLGLGLGVKGTGGH
jgi:hypothetical protein